MTGDSRASLMTLAHGFWSWRGRPRVPGASGYRLGLLLLLAIWLGLPSPAWARLSDPEAVEAISGIYNRSIQVNSFQSEFHLMRLDKEFLADFFPDSPFYDNMSLRGIINYDSPTGQYNLYFQIGGVDYHHFALRGDSVVYLGQERIYNLMKDPRPVRVEPSPSPSPSPEGLPSPSASPSPSPSPSPAAQEFTDLSPITRKAVPGHPLIYLWPYVLHQPNIRNTYSVVSSKEIVYGRRCLLIEAQGPTSRIPTRIWVDPRASQVMQVQVADFRTGRSIRSIYSGFYPKDSRTGYAIYNRLEVDVEGRPLFMAMLTGPTLNPARILSTGTGAETPTGLVDRPTRNVDVGPAARFLTQGMVALVLILALVLLVLGYRYLRFAVSRQEFSDELLVIDEEGGRFSELLTRLGYPIAPFNAEVLTQERLLLGKGATADTTRRPRGVIVAPECFAEAKGFFFLVRAFVEEGGRVLVMYHSPRAATSMPFSASYLPISPSDVSTDYSCRPGLFKTITDEDVARLANALAAQELYTKANSRPIAQEFLVGRNRSTGVKATAIGVVRQGKGEYILCQMRFEPEVTLSSAPVRRILRDLILFLQAGQAPKEEQVNP